MLRAVVFVAVLLRLQHSCYGGDEYHGGGGGGGERLSSPEAAPADVDPRFWAQEAEAAIEERLRRSDAGQHARNVIMFLGDGMSVATVTAARALLGEEARLSFEEFPTVGLAKTYCLDAQVADSACTATAYLCGSKANIGTVGVSGAVRRRDCSAATRPEHHVHSIAALALLDGRDAGVVTTTRVTHASPAGAFAHSADRDWESDADVAEHCAGYGARAQPDIAMQLVHAFPGDRFKVILGGGRREFLPNTTVDEEGTRGRRADGRDLIAEWQADKRRRNVSHAYAWNRDQLMEAAEDPPEYLLGLFEGGHMRYHLEADAAAEPTLAELTEAAVRALARNQRGFFLFVEGGRIDHAHHDNYARMALDETLEMATAVARAASITDAADTLIVVTADHAHVMAFSGYSRRGSDVLGFSDDAGADGLPYMTLSYANGPGYRPEEGGRREDLSRLHYRDREFRFPAAVPLESETHGGDDVAVFARGPHHRLFTGLYEQSQLPHLMAYAACLGAGRTACTDADNDAEPRA